MYIFPRHHVLVVSHFVSQSCLFLFSCTVYVLDLQWNAQQSRSACLCAVIYLICTMVISGLSLISTIFILTLRHHSSAIHQRAPAWLRRLSFVYLARILRMTDTAQQLADDSPMHLSTSATSAEEPASGASSYLEKSKDDANQEKILSLTSG